MTALLRTQDLIHRAEQARRRALHLCSPSLADSAFPRADGPATTEELIGRNRALLPRAAGLSAHAQTINRTAGDHLALAQLSLAERRSRWEARKAAAASEHKAAVSRRRSRLI